MHHTWHLQWSFTVFYGQYGVNGLPFLILRYKFGYLVGMFTFLAFEGYIFGIFFGVMCKDSNTAINLLPIFFITFLSVSGLPININDISPYISWMQYISPTRHGFFFLLIDQIKTDKINYINNQEAQDRFGIHGDIY
jgi:hypothetical protein